eukprot:TRINITY_DN63256_c0_g1_i1.p1 TRINITY_DN63256_c0_g1~~TRINITY_DN63256_c0_g1_i1.p1  ORF type:complete len:104 (-),score=28.33 TRINITY_DN63256_c0_g1_i1:232-543(-)
MAIAIFVSFEVKPDSLEEFKKIMGVDATETRKEPGCLRFDLLREKDSDTKYSLYEIYKDQAAMDHHVTTEHYKMWNNFKTEQQGLVDGTYKKVVSIAEDIVEQ